MIAKNIVTKMGVSLVPNVNDWNWIPNANVSTFSTSALLVGSYSATPYMNTNKTNMVTLTSNNVN
jgi:hypothetical protein